MRRDKTAIARMQDIAGIRLVLSSGRWEDQDNLAKAIAVSPKIAGTKIYDRREKSQHGYRAVHVVGVVDGYLVEFQIRTALQHRWAQTFERLADAWGRELRYGVKPHGLEQTITVGGALVSRAEVVGFMRDLSGQIYDVEASDARFDAQERRIVEAADDMSGAKQNQMLRELNEGRALIRHAANECMESLSPVLETFEQDGWKAAPAPKGTGSNAILVLYDRSKGILVDQLEGPSDKLVAVWREWDLQHRANPAMEIVLLTSPSIAELAQTHRRYFGSPRDLPRA